MDTADTARKLMMADQVAETLNEVGMGFFIYVRPDLEGGGIYRTNAMSQEDAFMAIHALVEEFAIDHDGLISYLRESVQEE